MLFLLTKHPVKNINNELFITIYDDTRIYEQKYRQ
jgi:hypothetical protein